MKFAIVSACVVAFGVVGFANAADLAVKPDDIIAGRQAAYDLQGGVFAAMKATIDAGGSVKPLADGAKGLVSWGHAIPGMFPVGTESGHNTKAKPEIWSDRATFEKDAANFTADAEKLVTLAEADDKAGFAAQWKETGGTCGACHRAFRNR
jgi:cytochrome c556